MVAMLSILLPERGVGEDPTSRELRKAVFLYFIPIGMFQIIMVRFGKYHNIEFLILDLRIMWVVII